MSCQKIEYRIFI